MTTIDISEHDRETLLRSFLVACWVKPREAYASLYIARPRQGWARA